MHHLVVKFSMTLNPWMYPVLWIRIGFNGDPDPAFFVNADPVQDFDDQKL
jgi:hypothetical protein